MDKTFLRYCLFWFMHQTIVNHYIITDVRFSYFKTISILSKFIIEFVVSLSSMFMYLSFSNSPFLIFSLSLSLALSLSYLFCSLSSRLLHVQGAFVGTEFHYNIFTMRPFFGRSYFFTLDDRRRLKKLSSFLKVDQPRQAIVKLSIT
jgi:hypothetical protein